MQRARLLALGLAIGVGVGCDPGMGYKSWSGPNHHPSDGGYLEVPASGVEARFYGNVFCAHGDFEVRVQNRSEVPLSFAPAPMRVGDADGRPIPADCFFSTGEAPVTLETGEGATIRCRIKVEVLSGCAGPHYGREIQHLTLAQPGFSREGRPLDLSVTLDAR